MYRRGEARWLTISQIFISVVSCDVVVHDTHCVLCAAVWFLILWQWIREASVVDRNLFGIRKECVGTVRCDGYNWHRIEYWMGDKGVFPSAHFPYDGPSHIRSIPHSSGHSACVTWVYTSARLWHGHENRKFPNLSIKHTSNVTMPSMAGHLINFAIFPMWIFQIEALVSTYFIAYFLSLIMCVCVELPFSVLQKQLFNKEKRPTESTQTVYGNSEPESRKLSKNLSDNLELKNNNNHLVN